MIHGRARPGFALVLVLWLLVGGVVLATGLAVAARSALLAVSNRNLLDRGYWKAEGCIERLRSVLDDTLLTSVAAAEHGWRSLDSVVLASPMLASCDLAVRPAGIALDVNTASPTDIAIAVGAAGWAPNADSVGDAIVDWRDADDFLLPNGAEAGWYLERHMLPPRNGLFRSRDELRRVRGLVDAPPAVIDVLDIEAGRIFVPRAPPALLLTLRGFGPEAIARATLFAGDQSPSDLLDFSTRLSTEARTEILANFAELHQQITWSPDAWIVTARASEGDPPVVTYIEIRLVRAGRRAAVIRWKTWP